MKELLETNKQMRKPCDICLEEISDWNCKKLF